jgi:glyoxylase I family protein
MKIEQVHHIAIIASDYKASKKFYTEVLGLPFRNETYREERDSWKLDLLLPGGVEIELF